MGIPKVLILVLFLLFVFTGNGYSDKLEELSSLPYLEWNPTADIKQSGVVKYDKNKAYDGYNLYTDDESNAYLIDMKGHVVYRWKFPTAKGNWQYVRLLDHGDIVALSYVKYFVKLDKNSKLIWDVPVAANHDIELLADGSFLISAFDTPVKYNNINVVFESIVHISKDGKIIGKWSTYDHLKELQKLHLPSVLDSNEGEGSKKDPTLYDKNKTFDYYHLNSIQALPDTSLGLKDKRFQKGNWLIGTRNVNLIFILDKDNQKIVWSWGPGVLDGPHMPRMLNNGNILIYDNGYNRNYSRVIMIDPESGKIVWEYKATPPESFYSKEGGSSQLLGNGNFFIFDTENGRAFEITPTGQIVWEYYIPEIMNGKRKGIYRMLRIPKEEVSDWLGK